MAHIKCRYFEWTCNHPHRMTAYIICHSPEYGDGCEWFTDSSKQGDVLVVYHECRHALKNYTQFEGDYKRYEYDDYAGLRISRRHIIRVNIEYLEIDGSVLIGGGAS